MHHFNYLPVPVGRSQHPLLLKLSSIGFRIIRPTREDDSDDLTAYHGGATLVRPSKCQRIGFEAMDHAPSAVGDALKSTVAAAKLLL